MEPAHLIAFNAALLAAMASPGPALMLAVANTLRLGWAGGVLTGCGLGLMAAGWTLAALMGLDAVFTLVPWAYAAIKTLGALYLMWLAWRCWRAAGAPPAAANAGGRRAVLQGLAVNAANPKSVLFAAAVIAVVLPPALSPAQKALVAANHLAVEIAVYTAAATVLSRPAIRAGYLRAKAWVDRATAAVLGALGLRLLVER